MMAAIMSELDWAALFEDADREIVALNLCSGFEAWRSCRFRYWMSTACVVQPHRYVPHCRGGVAGGCFVSVVEYDYWGSH